jgi:L-lysine exporter family protein LysE/ArgO
MVAKSPLMTKIAAWGGAAFLFTSGLMCLRSAIAGNKMNLSDKPADSVKKVVITSLAVTLLNPHVYIDTILLMGGISAQFEPDARVYYALGAVCASILWFYLLSFAGVKLAPLFSRKSTWRVLDAGMCSIMWAVGLSLII